MIFISHSTKDLEAAQRVKRELERDFACFLEADRRAGIPACVKWKPYLYDQLRAASAVVSVWSRNAAASRWCIAEITFADTQGKPIIPVCIDDAERDPVLAEYQELRFDDLPRLRKVVASLLTDRADWDPKRPLYPGMEAFDRKDAGVFFGRDLEIAAGAEHIRRLRRLGGSRFLVAIGPSGCGKSSLMRAGWLPALSADARSWIVVDPIRPGSDPSFRTAQAFARAAAERGAALDEGELCQRLSGAEPEVALARAADVLRSAAGRPEATVLLPVDQLEELLVREPGAKDPASHPFLDVLGSLAADPHGALLVVATLRSDLLVTFQRAAQRVGLAYAVFLVKPLSTLAIDEVIAGPARAAGLTFATDIVRDLKGGLGSGDALPLLADTLYRLWAKRGPSAEIGAEALKGIGGVRGSIHNAAEDVVELLVADAGALEDLRRAFLALARVDEEGRLVRRSARWDDVPIGARATLDGFVKARLLVRDGGPDGDVVRVAHEALFEAWRRLSGWLAEARARLGLIGEVRRDAAAYLTAGERERPSYLWRGERLEKARALLSGDLGPVERDFFDASRAAELAQRREQIAGLLGRIAVFEQRLAALEDEEDDAEFSPDLDAAERRRAYASIAEERAALHHDTARWRAEVAALQAATEPRAIERPVARP